MQRPFVSPELLLLYMHFWLPEMNGSFIRGWKCTDCLREQECEMCEELKFFRWLRHLVHFLFELLLVVASLLPYFTTHHRLWIATHDVPGYTRRQEDPQVQSIWVSTSGSEAQLSGRQGEKATHHGQPWNLVRPFFHFNWMWNKNVPNRFN